MIEAFLAVDSIGSAVIVILFLILLWAMNHLPKKKLSFAQRVLIGTACGMIFGLICYMLLRSAGEGPALVSGPGSWFAAATDIYIGLFCMLIGPIIFICTAHMVIHTPAFKVMPKEVRVKKQVNTLMVALSCGVGLVLGTIFNVGSLNGSLFGSIQAGGDSLPWILEGLMPADAASDLILGKVVSVFAAGGLVGMAARRMSGKYMDTIKPILDLIDAAFSTFESVAKTVIAWKPMGAFAIMAALTATYGPAVLLAIIKFILVLTLAAAVMLLLQLILSCIFGVSPAAFFKAGREAMIKALKTRSGSACLPEAKQALSEGLGLNKEITDETAAYAIASGMQGCGALFPAMALIFTVHMAGGAVTPGLIAAAVIVITISSYGITGAPGTATMAEFAAVMGTGMQEAIFGLGAMIAIDPICDVPRTLINVTGCMTNAIIAERRLRA